TLQELLDLWLESNGKRRRVRHHYGEADPLDSRRVPAQGGIDSEGLLAELEQLLARVRQLDSAKNRPDGPRLPTFSGQRTEVHVHRAVPVVEPQHAHLVQAVAGEETEILRQAVRHGRDVGKR